MNSLFPKQSKPSNINNGNLSTADLSANNCLLVWDVINGNLSNADLSANRFVDSISSSVADHGNIARHSVQSDAT